MLLQLVVFCGIRKVYELSVISDYQKVGDPIQHAEVGNVHHIKVLEDVDEYSVSNALREEDLAVLSNHFLLGLFVHYIQLFQVGDHFEGNLLADTHATH